MAVLNKDDFMKTINSLVGEDVSDDTISIIENVKDTIDDYENRIGDDWKKKYEDNDSAWRKKYKERFFSGETHEQMEQKELDGDVKPKRLTYEELFKQD